MKVRKGFVSNSSSSSFVVITAGTETLISDGDSEYLETCGKFSVDIDEMIKLLQDAKAKGNNTITITHGGGYEG